MQIYRPEECFAVRCVMAAIVLAVVGPGCGYDSSGEAPPGAADAGAGEPDPACPDAPAAPDDLGMCAAWACDEVPAPACWECGPVAANEGSECDGVEAGACLGGACEPVPDPQLAGSTTWEATTDTIDLDGEQVPLAIYLPVSDEPSPVIVLTHGFMLQPSMYASYGEHLASWGYAVVMPDLPGDIITQKTHRELGDLLAGVVDWVEAGASQPGNPLLGRVDASRIGLAGHSLGGKLSLLLASEDARIGAVFGIDPVDAAGSPFGGDPTGFPSVAPELMEQIAAPLGLLGETVNASGGLGPACAPAEDNFQQYYAAAHSPAIQIEVVGANHMSFLDDPSCGLTCSACPAGTDDPATTRALTRGYMTAFFQLTLSDQAQFRVYLTGQPMQADVADGLVIVEHKNGL